MKPLPCPFCGKEPYIYPLHPEVEGDAWGAVKCENPGCYAQPYVKDGIKIADDRGTLAYQQNAIIRWNKRWKQK